MRTVDAVVVGAGVNGLVAAAELALAGWTVALVERNEQIGGFIATEQRTRPHFLHDTYSSWHPQFLSGPAYRALGPDLHECGLEYVNSDDALCATVGSDGHVVMAYRSLRKTAAGFGHADDGRTYRRAVGRVKDNAEGLAALTEVELRSIAGVQVALGLLRSNGISGSESWLRDLATSGRSWCRRQFEGDEVDRLWVPWLLHAGLSPDHASGGFVIPAFAAQLHAFGLPVVVGGSGRFVDAFRALLDSLGVEVVTGAAVDRVVVVDGRAVGVEVNGETITATHAVIASVTPGALYGQLLPSEVVDPAVASEARRFRHGRAAMMVHVALDAPLRWHDERLDATPIVHLSDGSASTAVACAEAEAGLLPRRPTVVVGQPHVLDPSRVPAGAGVLWIQLLEVPFTPTADAAGELDTSDGWSPELARRYADRVLDLLSHHVQDLKRCVLSVDVVTPADLAAHNPNAVSGDPYGGDAQLDQSWLWRPLPSSSNHATAVPQLWHIGASTHPGAGLGGTSGHAVAQQLLASDAAPAPARARAALQRMMRRR